MQVFAGDREGVAAAPEPEDHRVVGNAPRISDFERYRIRAAGGAVGEWRQEDAGAGADRGLAAVQGCGERQELIAGEVRRHARGLALESVHVRADLAVLALGVAISAVASGAAASRAADRRAPAVGVDFAAALRARARPAHRGLRAAGV